MKLKNASASPKVLLQGQFLVCIACALFSSSAYANLLIVPTFDASITGDPNAAAMMAGINNAIAQIESKILNPVTVNITFKGDESVGLGQSSTSYSDTTYTQFRSDLMTNQTLSASDTAAIATLPAGPNNPVNASTGVHLTLPLLRAIGESALGDNGGGADSEISLKMSLVNFLRTGPQDPAKYDLQQVAMHEIVEVLGAGGGGSTLGDPGTSVGSLDLFRYSAAGVRSYSTAAASAYFSINGGITNLSFFNQTAGGDYADWDGDANHMPQVQDAYSGPGLQLDLSANELVALDIVGWNLSTVVGLPGDFNSDGRVNALDYVVWRHNNGPVADYNLWRAHFGESTPASGAANVASVPEPGCVVLVLAEALSLGTQRKKLL